jgi:hypothetical protein
MYQVRSIASPTSLQSKTNIKFNPCASPTQPTGLVRNGLSYLTACTFYSALFDRRPEGIPIGTVIDTLYSDREHRDLDRDGGPITRTFSANNRFAAIGSPDSICDRIRVTSDIVLAHTAILNDRNCSNLVSNLPEAYDIIPASRFRKPKAPQCGYGASRVRRL